MWSGTVGQCPDGIWIPDQLHVQTNYVILWMHMWMIINNNVVASCLCSRQSVVASQLSHLDISLLAVIICFCVHWFMVSFAAVVVLHLALPSCQWFWHWENSGGKYAKKNSKFLQKNVPRKKRSRVLPIVYLFQHNRPNFQYHNSGIYLFDCTVFQHRLQCRFNVLYSSVFSSIDLVYRSLAYAPMYGRFNVLYSSIGSGIDLMYCIPA